MALIKLNKRTGFTNKVLLFHRENPLMHMAGVARNVGCSTSNVSLIFKRYGLKAQKYTQHASLKRYVTVQECERMIQDALKSFSIDAR